jgi:predicted amidophosphoribosyltransferase
MQSGLAPTGLLNQWCQEIAMLEHISTYKSVKILSLGNYYSQRNSPVEHSTDLHSKNIIKFKNGEPEAIEYMSALLATVLNGSTLQNTAFYVATIPSSTFGRAHPGLTGLIKSIANDFRILNPNANLLKRTESKKPAHLGGSRSKSDLLTTLSVSPEPGISISRKPVLLLDDVTTTTNSLQVGIDLLLNANARVVAAIALGKTR